MDRKAYPPMPVPSATTPQWVPFPGTKRKAEPDSYYGEYGPPPKICAFEEDDNGVIISDDQFTPDEVISSSCSSESPSRPGLVLEGDDVDEEMRDSPQEEECPTTSDFNCAGAPFFDKNGTGGKRRAGGGSIEGMLWGSQHEHANYPESKSKDCNKCPKLYLFEDLREVLSSKPSADAMLEKVLRKEASTNNPSRTKALVLWKDPTIQPYFSSSPPRLKQEKGLDSRDTYRNQEDEKGKHRCETGMGKEFDEEEMAEDG